MATEEPGVAPSVMILTASCKRDRENGCQQAARETWVKEWPGAFHRFIIGSTFSPWADMHTQDEWFLPCPDDYANTPAKLHTALRWALACNADYVFYSDVDTYVCTPRLLASIPVDKDYVGLRCAEGHASGGAGFWLSRKAMKVIAAAVPPQGYHDLWAGTLLRDHDIPLHDDRRYGGDPNGWFANQITAHTGTHSGACDPSTMYRAHVACLASIACQPK